MENKSNGQEQRWGRQAITARFAYWHRSRCLLRAFLGHCGRVTRNGGRRKPFDRLRAFCLLDCSRANKMEAGGFEPPSRDALRQVSTCLVVLLFFRLAKRQTTGSWFSYFGVSCRSRPEQPTRPACYLTPLQNPQAKSYRTGCLIKQPFATGSCQLNFVAG